MRVMNESLHPSDFASTETYVSQKYVMNPIHMSAATSMQQMKHIPSNITVNPVTKYFFANDNLDQIQLFLQRTLAREGHTITRQNDTQLAIIMATVYNREFHTIKNKAPRDATQYLNTIVVNEVIPSIHKSIRARRRQMTDRYIPSARPKPIASHVDRSHHMPCKVERPRFR